MEPGKQRGGDTGALGLLRAGGHGGRLRPRGRDGLTLDKVKPELSLACLATWVDLQLTLGCSLAVPWNQSLEAQPSSGQASAGVPAVCRPGHQALGQL